MNAEISFLSPDLADEDELQKNQEMYMVIQWVQEITNQELLERIN